MINFVASWFRSWSKSNQFCCNLRILKILFSLIRDFQLNKIQFMFSQWGIYWRKNDTCFQPCLNDTFLKLTKGFYHILRTCWRFPLILFWLYLMSNLKKLISLLFPCWCNKNIFDDKTMVLMCAFIFLSVSQCLKRIWKRNLITIPALFSTCCCYKSGSELSTQHQVDQWEWMTPFRANVFSK